MTKKEIWQERIDQWGQSEANAAQFCREQGLNYCNFMHWKKKLTKPQAPSTFIPITEERFSFQANGIDFCVDENTPVEHLSRLVLAARLATSC